MAKKYELRIDVTDLAEEALRDERAFDSTEELIDYGVGQGMTIRQMGCRGLGARAAGLAKEEILPPNRTLLEVGAQEVTKERVQRMGDRVQVGKRTVFVPDFIGRPMQWPVGEEGDAEPGYVRRGDPLAQERVRQYVLKAIPGHVMGRMVTWREMGQDCGELMHELFELLREMLLELQAPPEPAAG